jgi:hypothetical protein
MSVPERPQVTRLARVYDGFAPGTGPYFAPGRGRLEDPAEWRRVAGYLRGGAIVARSFALGVDILDPGRTEAVPGSFRTDGDWLWNDGLMYYVERYGVSPDPDLYQHIAAAGYRCPEPDGPALRRAADALDRARRGPGTDEPVS